MSDTHEPTPHTEVQRGRLLARHHTPSYLERFRQPGDFTAFVLAVRTMTVTRLVVRADDADQAAAMVRARIDQAGRDAGCYDVIMTVPGIVGQCADMGNCQWG
jgi:hypothetical protein